MVFQYRFLNAFCDALSSSFTHLESLNVVPIDIRKRERRLYDIKEIGNYKSVHINYFGFFIKMYYKALSSIVIFYNFK